MQKYWKRILLLFLIALAAALLMSAASEQLSFEKIKIYSEQLAAFVKMHYLLSVLTFAAAILSTSFLVPGALILTLTGGFLFGIVPGAFYSSVFSTVGATMAFLLSRYVIGSWIQEQYAPYLKRFNDEISQHGQNYLFVLRIIPFMPAFMVNYVAGLTRISTPLFAAATFCGIFPGAFVYSLAGRQLRTIQTPGDIVSGKVLVGFLLMALFALLPVFWKHARRGKWRKFRGGT